MICRLTIFWASVAALYFLEVFFLEKIKYGEKLEIDKAIQR
jgi:hypothetical protein